MNAMGKRALHVPGFVLAAILTVLPVPGVTGGDRTFENERLALIKSIHQVLIAKDLCSDANECTKKQHVFAAPESFGLTVALYQVNAAAVLADVVKQCL